ncbi:hypothetical protein ACTJJ7_16390 [Phyllobacterium sp. 22229]|uniref:hypothetical protein n=1 Tax=Phyllobacterium sp. 22229 TaxID=3453895 RepID=UPI003F826C1D
MSYLGLHFNWIEEWSQFFQSCNWYTFHPVHLEIEDDDAMGGFEVSIVIFGLGFRIRWNHTETEQVSHIKDLAKLFDENGDAKP